MPLPKASLITIVVLLSSYVHASDNANDVSLQRKSKSTNYIQSRPFTVVNEKDNKLIIDGAVSIKTNGVPIPIVIDDSESRQKPLSVVLVDVNRDPVDLRVGTNPTWINNLTKAIEMLSRRIQEAKVLGLSELKLSVDTANSVPLKVEPVKGEISPVSIKLLADELRGPAAEALKETTPARAMIVETELHKMYPGASIKYAIASLPDPRIPRHRRAFDISIQALIDGMRGGEFQLDRNALPWNTEQDAAASPGSQKLGCDEPNASVKKCLGLLLFRRDLWRGHVGQNERCDDRRGGEDTVKSQAGTDACAEPSYEITAIYVVTETQTAGIDTVAFNEAYAQIQSGYSMAQGDRAETTGERITLFGPAFSGSMTSLYLTMSTRCDYRMFDRYLKVPYHCSFWPVPIKVDSYAATATSNSMIDKYLGRYNVTYSDSSTVKDKNKLLSIKKYLNSIGILSSSVAAVIEDSDYGKGLTDDWRDSFQDDSVCISGSAGWEPLVTVPPNIAMLRYAVERRSRSRQNLPESSKIPALPSDTLELTENFADEGSELPAVFSPDLGARAKQLQLDAQLRTLSACGIKAVIIGATEIRDRLFMATELRKRMPWAVLIDMEADVFLRHPTYLSATRGMLMASSAEISPGDRGGAFTTDDSRVLTEMISRWAGASAYEALHEGPFLYIVGLNGFHRVVVSNEDGWLALQARTLGTRFPLTSIVLFPLAVVCFLRKPNRLSITREMTRRVAERVRWVLDECKSWCIKNTVASGLLSLLLTVALLEYSFCLFDELRELNPFNWWPYLLVPLGIVLIGGGFRETRGVELPLLFCRSVRASGMWFGIAMLLMTALWILILLDRPLESSAALDRWNSAIVSMIVVLTTLVAMALILHGVRCYTKLRLELCNIRHVMCADGELSLKNWPATSGADVRSLREFSYCEIPIAVPSLGRSEVDAARAYIERRIVAIGNRTKFDVVVARLNLRVYVASLIVPVRRACVAVLCLAFFSIVAVYLYPIGATNALLSTNVMFVCIAAVALAYLVVALERNEVTSMLFRGEHGGVRWRLPFVLFLLAPIFVIVLAFWFTWVPGVRQWAESTVAPFLGRLMN